MTSTHFSTGHCAKSHPTKIIKFPHKKKHDREKIVQQQKKNMIFHSDFLLFLLLLFCFILLCV